MTRKDLEQVRYIKIEIEELKGEIQKARDRAYSRTVTGGKVSGRNRFWRSGVEYSVDTTSDIMNVIQSKTEHLERAYNEVMTFIMGIDDCQTRLIFKFRCINCMTWNQIADKIGGMNSEYSVKKRYYRYLDKMGIE